MIPLSVLSETITFEPYEGESGHGKPVYGTAIEVRARFTGQRRLIKNKDGQEIISSATILIRPGIEVPIKSLITCDGRAYEVVEVLPFSELNRPHHLAVLVS